MTHTTRRQFLRQMATAAVVPALPLALSGSPKETSKPTTVGKNRPELTDVPVLSVYRYSAFWTPFPPDSESIADSHSEPRLKVGITFQYERRYDIGCADSYDFRVAPEMDEVWLCVDGVSEYRACRCDDPDWQASKAFLIAAMLSESMVEERFRLQAMYEFLEHDAKEHRA